MTSRVQTLTAPSYDDGEVAAGRPVRRAGSRAPGTPPQPELQIVCDETCLWSIGPEWERLWRRAPDASPFNSPQWLLAWWRHLGGGPLRVLTLRAETRLVAILPLFVYVDQGIRRLLPLGISVSDRFDMVSEAEWSRSAGRIFAEALAGPNDEWDVCELHEVPGHSNIARDATVRAFQSVSPVLDLRRLSSLSSRSAARRRLHRARRKAALAGLRLDRPGPEAIGELFALHGKQWRARGGPGVMAQASVQAFHRDAARSLAQAGVLRMHRVQQDGRCLGLLYGFHSGDRASAYLSGTDPDAAALDLGTLLIGEAIDRAVEEGIRSFDFLRGAEPYKYLWGAVDESLFRLEFAPARRRPAPIPIRGREQASHATVIHSGGVR